jgi:hypothetical protein
MTSKLKRLAPALVAILAMNALIAAAAPAADVFTTSKEKAWVTGVTNGTYKFDFTNFILTCTTAHNIGQFNNGSQTMAVLGHYTGKIGATPHGFGCTVEAGGEATISMNDCEYTLTGSTTGSDNGTDATAWIQCPAGKEIEIALATGCTIKGSESDTDIGWCHLYQPS